MRAAAVEARLAALKDAAARNSLQGPKHAGQGLRERARRIVDGFRERKRGSGAGPLGEAAGDDRWLREALAGRLVPGAAAVAFAAWQVVDEGHALPLGILGDHLVPEYGAGGGPAELLNVRPAKPARAHGNELPGAVRLRDLRKR